MTSRFFPVLIAAFATLFRFTRCHPGSAALAAVMILAAPVATLAQETAADRQAPSAQESAQATPTPTQNGQATSAQADVGRELVVGLYINEPFVEKTKDGSYTGMAIDLWRGLAFALGYTYRFEEYGSVRELLEATASNRVDVAVANLTITEQRAHIVDFTQPWFDSGNRIMIASNQSSFGNLLEGLHNAGYLKAYAWIVGVILAATVLLTIFDRRFDPNFPRRWRDGFAESFYTVMLVATSGKPTTRKNLFGWVGRIWQGLWLAFGVAVVAYVTSTVTSVMTTLSLTNQITGLDDLNNQLVAVMSGSAQEEYARSVGLRVRGFGHLDEAVAALLEGEVAAIIDDAPVLEYYQHTHSDQPLEIVGRLFERQKYGFALPLGSPLTRPLTLAILAAIDADQVDELKSKYFGMEDY